VTLKIWMTLATFHWIYSSKSLLEKYWADFIVLIFQAPLSSINPTLFKSY
jgi:hypothetical protein